ncbi:hypothetical protein HID58_024908 [Brassica napus]|uniref:Uncharacterized protein n=1 Tax=Brassica napus TaxID=3708 RepID=A0ABQ8CJI6_BRANA|nr:hypothetical protein HID58_024908 [Brassica napus]
MSLFNVDQFDVQTVHLFRENKAYSPEFVAEMLRKALVRAMDVYEFLAGRIRLNPSSGSLDVDCNGAGAGFVVAKSEYTLEELGDLVYPNPSCAKLVTSELQSLPKDDQPFFPFQSARLLEALNTKDDDNQEVEKYVKMRDLRHVPYVCRHVGSP